MLYKRLSNKSTPRWHAEMLYSFLFDLLTNTPTTSRNSGVWAIAITEQFTRSAQQFLNATDWPRCCLTSRASSCSQYTPVAASFLASSRHAQITLPTTIWPTTVRKQSCMQLTHEWRAPYLPANLYTTSQTLHPSSCMHLIIHTSLLCRNTVAGMCSSTNE